MMEWNLPLRVDNQHTRLALRHPRGGSAGFMQHAHHYELHVVFVKFVGNLANTLVVLEQGCATAPRKMEMMLASI